MKRIVFILKEYWRVFKNYNPYSLIIRILLFLDSRKSNYQDSIEKWSCQKYYSSVSFCKKVFFICLIIFSAEISLSAKVELDRQAQRQLLPVFTRKVDPI